MKCLILLITFILFIITMDCRPQNQLQLQQLHHHHQQQQQQQQTPSVEIEKQKIIQLSPRNLNYNAKIDANTKEILEKIQQVNEKQGLISKFPRRPTFFKFEPIAYAKETNNRKSNHFRFPTDPFSNPILEYLDREKEVVNEKSKLQTTYPDYDYIQEKEENNNNSNNEEQPDNVIKRKIVHYQTWLVPTQNNIPLMQPQYYYYPLATVGNQNNTDNIKDLEKQTVENVKNIVQSPMPTIFNSYNNEMYRPGRQWQWPMGQYFPIVIKDPVIHMLNAVTSMIEYGPQGTPIGGRPPCRKKPRGRNSKTLPIDDNFVVEQNQKIKDKNKLILLTIDNLEISDNRGDYDEDNPENQMRKSKNNDKNKIYPNTLRYPILHPITSHFNYNKTTLSTVTTTTTTTKRPPSPPIRGPEIDIEEEEEDEHDEFDNEKAENIQVTNDGNKKLFSKDNTGSGIFIHKLKVRRGGVAIAGPGGIATAGSGGTAIVGPNGFAYTKPDSLAIAGSGTKVIAVEPQINLADIVNDTNKNKTVSSRIGKVVAIGPVVYYNRG